MERFTDTARLIEYYFEQGYRVVEKEFRSPPGKSNISIYLGSTGYPSVNLSRKGLGRTLVKIHLFVAYQKFGEDVFDTSLKRIEVRHIDDDKLNYLPDNLILGTSSDNKMDRSKALRMKIVKAAVSARRAFTDEEVRSMKQDLSSGLTYKDISVAYDRPYNSIYWLLTRTKYARDL